MRHKRTPIWKPLLFGSISLVLFLQWSLFHVQTPLHGVPPISLDSFVEHSRSNVITLLNHHFDEAKQPVRFLWKNSSTLPDWMIEYFDWHTEQRAILQQTWNTTSTSNRRRHGLLILQCLPMDGKCGGTADRLKPIPLILLAAHQSQRLFFIRWERPCALEHFLRVPTGGFDWRLPEWLDLGEYKSVSRRHVTNIHKFLNIVHSSNATDVVTTKLQWHNGGSTIFDNSLGRPGFFEDVYHELFGILFEPVPAIQNQLDAIYTSTGLQPGHYAAAHYRALWWEDQMAPNETEQVHAAINAAHCASELRPGGPIYFASDSVVASQGIQEYAQKSHRPIVTVRHAEVIHMDRAVVAVDDTIEKAPAILTGRDSFNADGMTQARVEDLYPIFVDLYLLKNANCMSYGDGGFGQYGLMLSQNHTCSKRHMFRHELKRCTWRD